MSGVEGGDDLGAGRVEAASVERTGRRPSGGERRGGVPYLLAVSSRGRRTLSFTGLTAFAG